MTKEDIQNKIEEIALNGATDGCNQAYIEREAEKLADSIVNLCNLPVVSARFLEAVEDIDSNGLECSIEDVGITDRYEAMQYGFDQCKERALEAIELAAD